MRRRAKRHGALLAVHWGMSTLTKAERAKEHKTISEPPAHVDHPGPNATTVEMTLAGAVAGAATGALAGPIGAIAGGVIGTLAGALAGNALSEDDEVHSRADKKLDKAIGVSGGDMGAASKDQPKSKRGTFSAASAGVGGGGGASPSEGPMQALDSDD
jgi:hypothetical protein